MGDIIGIGAGDAGEHVLEGFARHQITVGQGRLAEGGQQQVARVVQHQIGRHRLARQRRRIGRLTGDSRTRSCAAASGYAAPALFAGSRCWRTKLRPVGSLDQLAVLVEIAVNIVFSDRRHA